MGRVFEPAGDPWLRRNSLVFSTFTITLKGISSVIVSSPGQYHTPQRQIGEDQKIDLIRPTLHALKMSNCVIILNAFQHFISVAHTIIPTALLLYWNTWFTFSRNNIAAIPLKRCPITKHSSPTCTDTTWLLDNPITPQKFPKQPPRFWSTVGNPVSLLAIKCHVTWKELSNWLSKREYSVLWVVLTLPGLREEWWDNGF